MRTTCCLTIVAVSYLASAAATKSSAAEVKLTIAEPSGVARERWPVTSGVPFACGALTDPNSTALFDAEGRELPLQTEVLSRWPDGSIRWLLIDSQVTLAGKEQKSLTLRFGAEAWRAEIDQPVVVNESPNEVELDTGPLHVVLSKDSFRLLDAVWLDRDGDGQFDDSERVTSAAGAGIVLTTPDGGQFRADLSKADIVVEQSGPLRACVRISGRHASEAGSMFGYIVRVHAFRGQPHLKLSYTFINDQQERLMSKVDSVELVVSSSNDGKIAIIDGKESGPGQLFQVDDRSYEVDGEPVGERAAGWAALGGPNGGMAVGVREFWQNWPKSLAVGHASSLQRQDDRLEACPTLRVGICPQFEPGRYDGKPIKEEAQLYYYLRDGEYAFKVGVSRTHELWATFFAGEPDVQELSDFFAATEQPLLAQPTPEYVYATEAAGRIAPAKATAAYARYDAWLNELFKLHLADVDDVREYGLLNFGDWYNIKWDSWGNLEYDTARCFFTQYLRTGDRRYFDRASEAARHYLDVDVVHAVNEHLHEFPGSAKMQPGHVWLHQVGHTGGYYGRYDGDKYHDEAPLIMKGPYQVGMYNWGHQWIGGVFDYYLLTGDRRALEVATMTADAIAADCPTHYSDHIRDLGWPLNLVIAAYESTGDQKYLDAATRQWKLLQEHFDPDKGFQVLLAYGHCNEQSVAKRCRGQNAYMFGLTLSGLARYHRLTNDPEVLQGLTAGIDQLIRECWSEEHKTFYLTSCVHFHHNPPPALCSATALSAEAFAYESQLTGNKEHWRIWREAFRTMVDAGFESALRREQEGQTGYSSMMFHFTPHALWKLDEDGD